MSGIAFKVAINTFHQLRANKLKEMLTFKQQNFRMYLHIVNFTKKKLSLKPIPLFEDFSPRFRSAIRKLSAVTNGTMNRNTINI